MLSKREPCSVGFLEELIVILEFHEKGSLTVIPICLTPYPFVDVEEETCQLFPENAPSWRAALTKLSNIATEYPSSRNVKSLFLSDWLKEVARDICLQVLFHIERFECPCCNGSSHGSFLRVVGGFRC
ncbi:hypothetical protein Bca52824_027430 [Brassica carinata]|uniref:Uncharacterized protein n=1 Tax=Brassica carinata TaxID=52824 RepID=A0A8X7V9S2_BRACI|nr:hypothetical protein Bca52824_027430 [Brassica carinata]